MASPRILFVDDDPVSRHLVEKMLQQAEMMPYLAQDGAQALEIWHNTPLDLIILDIMMPVMDGLETCRRIRRVSEIPIMMLTARGSEDDIIQGFEAGADDYLVKPFRPKELVARIRAILRRMSPMTTITPPENKLSYGDLTLDLTARRVTRRDEVIPVTPLEFRLLHYLLQRVGVVVSKEELFRDVWGYAMPSGGMNLIEVTIRRLRGKIEDTPDRPRYIQTVWGVGYRFGN